MRTTRMVVVLAVLTTVLGGCGAGGPTPTSARASTAQPRGAPSSGADDVTPVRFTGDGVELRAALRLPDGAGPHPGVVLVHGSGPVDRDGTVTGQLAMTFLRPVTVFADLAAGLRDAGYAVLTYDKRSCGPFNGCGDNGYPRPPDDLTIDAFVRDAQSAVEHLRTRPEVDADAVVVAGHSQGASFVPGMLLDDPRLAAGIMLSAPFDPVDRLLADQAATVEDVVARKAPRRAGADAEVARLRRLARTVRRLRSGYGADDANIGGASAGFWRSWLRLSDGVPQLAEQAEQPVLVLTGGADTNVGARQTARWRETLTGDGDVVVEVPCVSHALNSLGTDDVRAVDPAAIDHRVDPRVIDGVAAFLDATLP